MNSGLDHLLGEAMDFRVSTATRVILFIAATPRSGSNFLCSELWRRGSLGAPWEYFNRKFVVRTLSRRIGARDRASYIEKVAKLRTGSNGVFALKIFYYDYLVFEADLLNFFQGKEVRYVHLIRSSLDDQVNSLIVARKTNVWAKTSLGTTAASPIQAKPDNEAIRAQLLQSVVDQNAAWSKYFADRSLSPLVLKYEELAFPESAEKVESLMDIKSRPSNVEGIPYFFKQSVI
jgi:LPS sulfotransferase NodH